MTAPTAGPAPYVPRHLASGRRPRFGLAPTTAPRRALGARRPASAPPRRVGAPAPRADRVGAPAPSAEATGRPPRMSTPAATVRAPTAAPRVPRMGARAPSAGTVGSTPRVRPSSGAGRSGPHEHALTGTNGRGAPEAADGAWWRRLVERLTPGPRAGARRLLAPVTVGFALAALSGCAERRLVAAPQSPPATSTWTAVWCAGVLAAVVLGVLLTLPAWRSRGGASLAVVLFTAQAGLVAVTGAVLSSVALRSWQLIDHPVDSAPAVALLRLSRADGDTGFFALMVLLVVIVAALLVTLLSMSAQFARGHDPVERTVACGVLALQLGGCAYAAVRLLLGARGWSYAGATALLPLVVIAFATCWPSPEDHRTTHPAPPVPAPAPAG